MYLYHTVLCCSQINLVLPEGKKKQKERECCLKNTIMVKDCFSVNSTGSLHGTKEHMNQIMLEENVITSTKKQKQIFQQDRSQHLVKNKRLVAKKKKVKPIPWLESNRNIWHDFESIIRMLLALRNWRWFAKRNGLKLNGKAANYFWKQTSQSYYYQSSNINNLWCFSYQFQSPKFLIKTYHMYTGSGYMHRKCIK